MDRRVGQIEPRGEAGAMSMLAVWVSLMATLFGAAEDPECYLLGALDVARAGALADANLTELQAVYASGQVAARDSRVLKRYAARGYRIVGAGMVRESCRTVHRSADRIEFVVSERLAPAWAVSEAGTATRLPRSRPERHRVVLIAQDGRWRIGSVD